MQSFELCLRPAWPFEEVVIDKAPGQTSKLYCLSQGDRLSVKWLLWLFQCCWTVMILPVVLLTGTCKSSLDLQVRVHFNGLARMASELARKAEKLIFTAKMDSRIHGYPRVRPRRVHESNLFFIPSISTIQCSWFKQTSLTHCHSFAHLLAHSLTHYRTYINPYLFW